MLLAVAEGKYSIHCVENHGRVDHSIGIQLSQVLDLGNSALIELEVVIFKTCCDIFKNIVDHHNDKFLVILVQMTDNFCKSMNVAILDFAWF